MDQTIKRRLIRRLLAVAIVLTVLAGTAALYFEMGQVDDMVVGLAVEESHGMMDHVAFLSLRDPGDFESLRKEVESHLRAEHLAMGNFVIIKLLDRDRREVISVVQQALADAGTIIDGMRGSMQRRDGVAYRTFYVAPRFYVKVSVPLVYAAGEVAGYFEGVYRVDPATMGAVRMRLLGAVLLVLIIVSLTVAAVYPVILALNRDMTRLQDDLTASNIGMLEMLGSAIAKRDSETNSHNYRVTLYAIRLAESAGMHRKDIRGLIKGAFLHDVGKIGISDTLLHKPAALSVSEAQVMETHVQHGVDIIGKYQWLRDALDVVQYHHEKYDGTGYRTGRKGRDIPVIARIFAIVDVFDALTSKRPYKGPVPLDETLKAMAEERGTRFDPELFDLFLRIASALYFEVHLADDEQLAALLASLREKYFAQAR